VFVITNMLSWWMQQCLVGMCTRTPDNLTEISRGFPQYLEANFEIVLWLGHDYFLPNPFQFIIYQSFYYLTISNLRYWRRKSNTNFMFIWIWSTQRSLEPFVISIAWEIGLLVLGSDYKQHCCHLWTWIALWYIRIITSEILCSFNHFRKFIYRVILFWIMMNN
jgi:hypothetical protein